MKWKQKIARINLHLQHYNHYYKSLLMCLRSLGNFHQRDLVIDHRIILKEGAKPPNLRPYRVPHYQKAAMEEIIKQLIKKGEIQERFSPFFFSSYNGQKEGWRMEIVCGLQRVKCYHCQKQISNTNY